MFPFHHQFESGRRLEACRLARDIVLRLVPERSVVRYFRLREIRPKEETGWRHRTNIEDHFRVNQNVELCVAKNKAGSTES